MIELLLGILIIAFGVYLVGMCLFGFVLAGIVAWKDRHEMTTYGLRTPSEIPHVIGGRRRKP